VGLVILVFVILTISASALLLREWNNRQAVTGHREPLPALNYCAPDRATPCVLSFNIDSDGDLVIRLLSNRSVPDFDLQIRREDGLSTYDCRKGARFSTSVTCTGDAVPVGESLEFLVVSRYEKRLLAEGTFPIIGLALATPDIAVAPTPDPLWDSPLK
jgi:hypothetical protein